MSDQDSHPHTDSKWHRVPGTGTVTLEQFLSDAHFFTNGEPEAQRPNNLNGIYKADYRCILQGSSAGSLIASVHYIEVSREAQQRNVIQASFWVGRLLCAHTYCKQRQSPKQEDPETMITVNRKRCKTCEK